MKKTHTCGELNISNIGQSVILEGWIKKIRKMGQKTFIDIRDIKGITQLVIGENLIDKVTELRTEYVIRVTGKVVERLSKNSEIKTGEIEIEVKEIELINKSDVTPFVIENQVDVNEDTRMIYRYLDLRREKMQQNLITRAKINQVIRKEVESQGFLEVETPYFAKSTPEGARDFLVPSRINKNTFYALPQSPQLYKQLLMIGGIDKYYQIVRCFRDEDLRIDRQPEFTQFDMEVSFASASDIRKIIENLMKRILKEIKGIDIKEKLPRMKFADAIDMYGSDKPDIRYDLKIKTLNDIFTNTEVKLFSDLKNKSIRGIFIDQLLTKKELEVLNETAKQKNFNGIAFAKFENGIWSGSIASSLSDSEKLKLIQLFEIKDKGTIILNIGDYDKVSDMMGSIRTKVAELYSLANPNEFKLLWVVDFPLFEYSEEEEKYVAAHHPFTMPNEKSLNDFETNKKDAIADSFDIVMNGFELGSGSVRITNPDIQERMFKAVGLSEQKVEENFGWFVNAYKYGAPNHAGMALGIDRIVMILTQAESIKDVIAFPKNSKGIDMMNNAPGFVDQKQLDELNIELKK